MVLTSRKLQDQLGINSRIADYFANERPVPTNNLFWQGKRIYVSGGFGFLTIPMAFDLLHKMGVPLDQLLADAHVSVMEQGFHELKRYENKEISFNTFLDQCYTMWGPALKQQHLADDLYAVLQGKATTYFQFETAHQALARSDAFLFTIVDLDLSDEWVKQFLPYWYALARPILLLDDFKDLVEDRLQNEENTIIEMGDHAKGIEAAYALGLADIEKLGTINPQLAKFMLTSFKDALRYDHIQAELD